MSAISGYDFEIILGTREDFVLGYVFMFDSAVRFTFMAFKFIYIHIVYV